VSLLEGVPEPLAKSAPHLGTAIMEVRRENDGVIRWTRQINFPAGLRPAAAVEELRDLADQVRHLSRRAWVGRLPAGNR